MIGGTVPARTSFAQEPLAKLRAEVYLRDMNTTTTQLVAAAQAAFAKCDACRTLRHDWRTAHVQEAPMADSIHCATCGYDRTILNGETEADARRAHEGTDAHRNATPALLTVAQAVARAKREILEDMGTGRVPANVATFGALHDYVDANEYGGLCTDAWMAPGDDEDPATRLRFDEAAQVQEQLHDWLRTGRPSQDAR